MILVPNLQFNVFGFQLSYNFVNTVIIGSYLYKLSINNQFNIKEKVQIDFNVIIPFLFLFLSLLFLSFFAESLPFNLQFNYWRVAFMKTCVVPFVFWNIAKEDRLFILNTKKVLIGSLIVAGVYGIYLLRSNGMNPYTTHLANYFGNMDAAEVFSSVASRLSFSSAGKIQSTMIHPMTYAFVLCFMILMLSCQFVIEKKKNYLPVIILLLFNLLISGVRTGIAALMIGFSYFIIVNKQFKLFLLGIVVVSISYYAIKSNDDVTAIFASMVDVSGNKYDMNGSSIPMRLRQLDGTFIEIKQNGFWVGKGYGWTNNYTKTYGTHPTIAGFESLIFSILLNSGVIGAICWSIFFLLIFRLNRRLLKSKQSVFLLDTYTIVYLSYAIGTGEYGYISFFSIFYTLLYADVTSEKKQRVDYDKQKNTSYRLLSPTVPPNS